MSQLVQEIGIAKEMAAFGAEWLPAVPMSEHTSLEVGGRADMVRVRDLRHIPELVEYLDERGIPWRFLGGGSNLLISDDDRSDVMIHLARGPSDVVLMETACRFPRRPIWEPRFCNVPRRTWGGWKAWWAFPGP